MSRGVAICLSGPDGSGKSTLARMLIRYLRHRKRLSVQYVWMRGTHTVAAVLARFLSRFSYFRGGDNPYYKIRVPPRMRRFWTWLEFVSILPHVLLRIALPRLLGSVIVADRCLVDTAVWSALTLRSIRVLKSLVTRIMFSLNMRLFDYIVYVTASARTILSRKPEHGVEFVLRQLVLYNALSRILGMYRIDTTSRTPEECLRQLLKLIRA